MDNIRGADPLTKTEADQMKLARTLEEVKSNGPELRTEFLRKGDPCRSLGAPGYGAFTN